MSGIPKIKVPFTVKDVIEHALTHPTIYNMELLESLRGHELINNVIVELNLGIIPQNFSYIAWNTSQQNAGYNKSLIASYVSRYY